MALRSEPRHLRMSYWYPGAGGPVPVRSRTPGSARVRLHLAGLGEGRPALRRDVPPSVTLTGPQEDANGPSSVTAMMIANAWSG